MNSRTVHRSPAIVLRSRDYGESDRIVTFLTLDYGKLTGIAKGARKSRRRFVNTLDTFCLSELHFSQRRPEGLAFLELCDMIQHYGSIRSDLEKTVMASHLVELVDAFAPERKNNEALFTLLQDFLGLLNDGSEAGGLVRYFEIRLLKIMGYDPVLDRCVVCGQPILSAGGYRFHPLAGGLKCAACAPGEAGYCLCSPGTARTLLLAKDLPPERLRRVVLTHQGALESERLLSRFITHLLGKELKSLRVLAQLQRTAGSSAPGNGAAASPGRT
jgi:DNA repair protein RecO (recombination protein O)